MDKMIKKLNSFKNGEKVIIIWSDDTKKVSIEGTIDTIYESDNCLDEDDPNYKEFYACAVRIDKFLCKEGIFNKKEGNLIEVSIDNQPVQIQNMDGDIVWDINIDGV